MLAGQMSDLGLASKGNTESILHTLKSVSESVLDSFLRTDSSTKDGISVLKQKIDESKDLICRDIRRPAESVEVLKSSVSVCALVNPMRAPWCLFLRRASCFFSFQIQIQTPFVYTQVLTERADFIIEACRSGFGVGDKRMHELGEALLESHRLGEDAVLRLQHVSSELERTGELVELARKPGEQAVEMLRQTREV